MVKALPTSPSVTMSFLSTLLVSRSPLLHRSTHNHQHLECRECKFCKSGKTNLCGKGFSSSSSFPQCKHSALFSPYHPRPRPHARRNNPFLHKWPTNPSLCMLILIKCLNGQIQSCLDGYFDVLPIHCRSRRFCSCSRQKCTSRQSLSSRLWNHDCLGCSNKTTRNWCV